MSVGTIMDLTGKQVTYSVFYMAISLLAVAGNGIVIYLVVNFRQMRSVTNFFILNLALGDLLMVVLCIPFTFTSSFILFHWPFGETMCRLVSYSSAVSVFISAYTLVAISIDRYIAIISPLRPRMTKAHSYQIIVLIWFFSLLTPVPIAVLSKTQYRFETNQPSITNQSATTYTAYHSVNNISSSSPSSQTLPSFLTSSSLSVSSESLSPPPMASPLSSASSSSSVSSAISSVNAKCDCIEDWETWPGENYRDIYSLMLMTLQYVIPFTILVFTYTRIGLVVWGKQTPGEAYGQRDAKMAASKRKMVQMMIMSGTTFTLCWLPFNIVTVMGERVNQSPYFEYLWITCHWLAMSHASYNPIIYIWMNSRYRAGFVHVGRQLWDTFFCCRLVCCSKESTERDHSYPFTNSVLHVYQTNTTHTNGRKI